MNILLSITNFEIGGTPNFVSRLANELCIDNNIYIYIHDSEQINDVLIKAINKKIKILKSPSYLLKRLTKIWILNFIVNKYSLLYQLDKLYIKYTIYSRKINIINSFMYLSDSFITKALEKVHIPIIISTRGCYKHIDEFSNLNLKERDYFYQQVKRIFLRASGVVWLNEENFEIISKVGIKLNIPNKQIYNGLKMPDKNNIADIDFYNLGIENPSLIFGMIARGVYYKGWYELIEAFIIILNKKPFYKNIYLILIGEGIYLSKLQNIYKRYKNIKFIGKTTDPYKWIKAFDVCVLPTRTESMPNILIEYLAFSKPIITTKVSEIPKMLDTEGELPGVLLEIKKNGCVDINQLASVMESFIINHELIIKYSNVAKKTFLKFDINRCKINYLQFYESIYKSYKK